MAQGVAIGARRPLLFLLASGSPPRRGGANRQAREPGESWRRTSRSSVSTRTGDLAVVVAREGGRPERLGVVVHPVEDEAPYLEQGCARTATGRRRRWARREGLPRRRAPFLRSATPSRPFVYDGPGRRSATGVTGFPETFVIDRRGKWSRAIAGAVERSERGGVERGNCARDRATVVMRGARARCARRSHGTATAAPSAGRSRSRDRCPVCETTLDQSNAPIAQRMKAFIREPHRRGATRRRRSRTRSSRSSVRSARGAAGGGFGLLAWLVPLGGLVAGAVVVGSDRLVLEPPSTDGPSPTPAALDAELERLVDEELAPVRAYLPRT